MRRSLLLVLAALGLTGCGPQLVPLDDEVGYITDRWHVPESTDCFPYTYWTDEDHNGSQETSHISIKCETSDEEFWVRVDWDARRWRNPETEEITRDWEFSEDRQVSRSEYQRCREGYRWNRTTDSCKRPLR